MLHLIRGTLVLFFLIQLTNAEARAVKKHVVDTGFGLSEVYLEKNGENYIFEGDIMMDPLSHYDKSLVNKGFTRRLSKRKQWPNRTIPFVIDSRIPNQNRIHEAIAHYHKYTKIRLVKRTNQRDYVYFNYNGKNGGCSSWIGRKGRKQKINVPDWCGKGSIIHEIGHALGLYHEHTRWDRNKLIDVVWSNIKVRYWFNYIRHPFGVMTGKLDFDSIMLYPSFNGFARDRSKPTMVHRVTGKPFYSNRRELSPGDLAALKFLYRY
jgi:hypothetical protein